MRGGSGAYNGTTVRPYSITGCGRPACDRGWNTQAPEDAERRGTTSAADAEKNSSAAIDPFNKRVDLDCE